MKKVFAAILVLALLFTLTASFADTWICEKCGRESERNFCSWCGAPKPKEPVICPNCGEKFDPDAGYAFCNNCGAVLRDEKQIIKPEEGTRGTCDGFDYIVLEDGTVEITGYSGTDSELVIPGELDGLTVTGIGKNAFNSCTTLFSAVIPDGVTYIDDYAFYGCRGLTEISIPDSVSTIGINPFDWCDRLTEFKLSPDHPFLEVTDGVLFGKADRKLICYPASLKSESYSVPDGTLLLGDEAFYNNRYDSGQR